MRYLRYVLLAVVAALAIIGPAVANAAPTETASQVAAWQSKWKPINAEVKAIDAAMLKAVNETSSISYEQAVVRWKKLETRADAAATKVANFKGAPATLKPKRAKLAKGLRILGDDAAYAWDAFQWGLDNNSPATGASGAFQHMVSTLHTDVRPPQKAIARAAGLTPKAAQHATLARDICGGDLSPFVGELVQIDFSLGDGGMYYKDYRAAVKKARAAYLRIDVAGLSQACVSKVGVPAEKALNRYVTARNVWAQYAERDKKTPAAKVKQIQRLWNQADNFIETAVKGL